MDERWKKRFAAMMAVRIGGLLAALVGLFLMRGGIIMDDPMPIVGIALVLLGIVASFLGPRMLIRARGWSDR